MESDNLLQMTSASTATLRELMDTYGNDIWNYAFFLTGSREEADDISQEVFIKIYLKAELFRGQSSMKTWLLTITRNLTFSWKRKMKRRKAIFQTSGSLPNGSSTQNHPSAETEVMVKQYNDDIWNIIMRLPAPYLETLVLDIKYDMSIAEMSSLLRVAPGTVKSRLSRAREKVRAALDKEEEQ